MSREELVYRLSNSDSENGLDAKEIARFLVAFDSLIHEVARAEGVASEVTVGIKPFREGSFITEFVVQGLADLTDFLNSPGASAAANFVGVAPVVPFIWKVIKSVKGKVTSFTTQKDGSVKYGQGKNAVVVPHEVHEAIQSPSVAKQFHEVAMGPLVSFNGTVNQVNIYSRDQSAKDGGQADGATISKSDKAVFDTYIAAVNSRIEEEQAAKISVIHDLWLRPISGSYGGGEKGYTFQSGAGDDRKKYANVRIEDEEFLARITDGDVRLNSGDLMCVDLEVTLNASSAKATYRVLEVKDYKPLENPHQLTFAEFLKSSQDESDGS